MALARSYPLYVVDEMVMTGAQPGTVGWIANIIRRHCPTATGFYCIDESPGLVTVVVEAADAKLSLLVDVQADLREEAAAGMGYQVEYTLTSGAQYRRRRSAAAVTAAELNKMQDAAAAEFARLRGENETLRQKVLEHQSALVQAIDLARSCREGEKAALKALDEQTQFLAGLDERRWSKPEQERRRALVKKAHDLVNPDGSVADELMVEEQKLRDLVRGSLEQFKGKKVAEVDFGGWARAWFRGVELPGTFLGGFPHAGRTRAAEYAAMCDEILSRDAIAQAAIKALPMAKISADNPKRIEFSLPIDHLHTTLADKAAPFDPPAGGAWLGDEARFPQKGKDEP